MPRFPVNFRRRSVTEAQQNAPAPTESSFRVLERPEASGEKAFDGGARMARTTAPLPKTSVSEISMEDNMFAGIKNNRGSGSSTTKTASDNSSRHSNASTAPSSTDYPAHYNDARDASKRNAAIAMSDSPPVSKSSGGFLKAASRTFSFGGNKKHALPPIPADHPVPVPALPKSRDRNDAPDAPAVTTPPRVENDFMLDLGGDLSGMFSKFDKRSSMATLKDQPQQPPVAPGARANLPAPLNLNRSAGPIDPPQHSWNSQGSNDELLGLPASRQSPPTSNLGVPPPVPRHGASPISTATPAGRSPMSGRTPVSARSPASARSPISAINPYGRQESDPEDEDATLLSDTLAATQFLSSNNTPSAQIHSQFTRAEDRSAAPFRTTLTETYAKPVDEENMFAQSPSRNTRYAGRFAGPRSKTEPLNKVMTPEEFEKYRQDKVKQERLDNAEKAASDDEEDINYDDDEEDELEKSKQAAKQRRKQEAHMTVYRQQMMKVTGEDGNGAAPPRSSLSTSTSTPNLPLRGPSRGPSPNDRAPSDESSDEEVPLAILAAHGFPNKNRVPSRLEQTSSNPNLRASMQPSWAPGPGSALGDVGAKGGPLPPFARRLPQDPYVGAGLVNQPPREQFAMGGGAAQPPISPQRAAPPGGLVGVIASEERSRAARRGSPAVDNNRNFMPSSNGMPPMNNGGFDPMAGIPPQMMYPGGMPQMQPPQLSVGDHAQLQMNQQMQQFMQMQMQFMSMMAGQGQGQPQSPGQFQGQGQQPMQARPMSHMPSQSMGSFPDMNRNSFMGDMPPRPGTGMGLEPPRMDAHSRTMSMVHPNNSWLQPPQPGFAPSIHTPGGGYTPSIAPSERSNVGLPGRYRPVSSIIPSDPSARTATLSGALPSMPSKHSSSGPSTTTTTTKDDDDDDDEKGWEAMKASRDKKKSNWRTKKAYGSEIGALIT